jgi:hypothetical protein
VETFVDRTGKYDNEIVAELEKMKGKQSVKNMAEAHAKIILQVEGSQLVHMCDRDPMAIWKALAQVHW